MEIGTTSENVWEWGRDRNNKHGNGDGHKCVPALQFIQPQESP